MRNIKWIIIALVLGFLSFVPVVTVNVVPEWSLRLVDETGEPVPNARVDQSWKDYSLEFFLSRHFDESLSSDADGIVRFPVRDIQVSTIQMVAAKIRGIILRIDPHASYGPGSHVYCRGSLTCDGTTTPGTEDSQVLIR